MKYTQRKINDLTDQKFGRLVAKKWVKKLVGNRLRGAWECDCECGQKLTVLTESITSGHTKSCGCFFRDEAGKRQITHGLSKVNGKATPTFISWSAMMARCNSPGTYGYKFYGAKGVTVCERWYSYVNFIDDMGERPKGLSLDRINPFGNYEKDNCRWATNKEQQDNTRANWLKRNTLNH